MDAEAQEKIEFGLRLKALIKKNGLTQAEFADLVGMTQGGLHGCLSGRNYLEFSTLKKAAKILGVSLDYLAFGEEGRPQLTTSELDVLKELDEHIYKESEGEILYLLSLIKKLEASAREEILEVVLQSFHGAIRVTLNRKTKEYIIAEGSHGESEQIS